MKILHLIGYLSSEMGGPVFSLKLLSDSKRESGHDVKIAHTSKNSDRKVLKFNELVKEVKKQ